MKKNLFFLIVVCLTTFCFAQTSNHGAKIEFEKTDYDFGIIDKGDSAIYDFVFKNNGDDVLIIEKIFSNNYITAIDYTKTPIKPGEKGKVTLSFNTDNIGRFSKRITVKTNAVNKSRSILCMNGLIIDHKEPEIKNGKWGVQKVTGEVLIPFKYDLLKWSPQLSCFIAKENNLFGLLDRHGNTIIPIEYSEISYFAKDLLKVKKIKWGVQKINGEVLIPFKYDELEWIPRLSCFIAKKNRLVGVLDMQDNTIIPFEYTELSYFAKDYFKAKKIKWGLIQVNNEVIYEFTADDFDFFSDDFIFGGLFAVRIGTTWDVVKFDGKCVVGRFIFDSIEGDVFYVWKQVNDDSLYKIDCDGVDDVYLQQHTYKEKRK